MCVSSNSVRTFFFSGKGRRHHTIARSSRPDDPMPARKLQLQRKGPGCPQSALENLTGDQYITGYMYDFKNLCIYGKYIRIMEEKMWITTV